MTGGSDLETVRKDYGALSDHIADYAISSRPLIRVLHVDDESATLSLTKQLLEMNDPFLSVESVGSAEEALRVLEERRFDCIVSDYQMPGMDGIEFARKIKGKMNIPFIIYTGRGSEEVAEAAFAVGVDDYIRKEIDPSHYQVLARRIKMAVEKRRAEDRLSGSEERFKNISESSYDVIFTMDIGGDFTYLSPSTERVTGYKAEEMMGRRFSDFLSKPEIPGTIQEFKEFIEKGSAESLQVKIRHRDGSIVHAEISASLMMKGGQVVGIQGILRDITERKKAEEALRSSEEQARRLLEFQKKIIDTAIVWIDLLDEESNVILWNRAAELISGYSRDEVIGHKRVWEWLYPDPGYRVELIDSVKDILEGKIEENFESTIRCKDGTSKIISWYETNILDDKGKPVGTIAVGIDTTARKRYEERLEALHSNATELSKARSIEEIAERTFDAIELVLGPSRGGFGVVEGGIIRFIHLRGMETTEYFEIPLDGPGVTVRTVKTGETQLIRDTRLDMDFTKVVVEEPLNSLSELSVPVKVGDEVVAVINIESNRIDAFTEDDQRLLEILAEHVASAIRGLREQAEQRRYEERLEALHRHVTELGMTKTLQEVAERTFDTIERVLGFNIGGFAIVDGSKLRFIHNRGIDTNDFEMPLDGSGITVRAVKTGKTQLVSDVRKDEDYIHGAFEGVIDTLSELTVPVRVGGSVTAVINVESERLNAFTEEDRKLLEIFAEHIASTIRRLEEQAEQRRYEERLEALHRHASELVMAKDIGEMAESTLFSIEQTIRFEQGSFGVVSEGYLKFILIKGIKGEPNVVELPLDGPGITIRAVKTGETQRTADVRQEKDFVLGTANGVYQPLSELAVPVKVEGEVFAIINLESGLIDAFTEHDQKLLETLALHVASAFQRLREQEKQRRYEERLETLHRHVHELGLANNMDDVTAATFRAIQQTLGFDRGSLGLVEDDFIYFRNLTSYISKITRLPLDGPGITVRTVRTGETQLVHDVRKDKDFLSGQSDETKTSLSELDVPIKIQGKTVAVINIESSELDAFTEEDKRLIEIFADHVASAILRLRNEKEHLHYEERLESLHQHANELSTASTVREIGEATLKAIEHVFGFKRGSFAVVEGDILNHILIRGLDIDSYKMPLDGKGVTVRVVRTGRTQLVPDIEKDEDFVRGIAEDELEPLSELAVPVKVGGVVAAVINVESEKLNVFTEEDQKLLEIFAEHIASAMTRLSQMKEMEASEARLRVERDRLEMLNEKLNVVGKLARHDVRNKLAVIMNNIYLARRRLKDDHEVVEQLDDIKDTCNHIVSIFEFSSAYEKVGCEELKPISVEESFRSAIGMLNLSGVELEIRCGGLTVYADSLLSRVFYNLVDNSLKHGDHVRKIRLYSENEGGLRIVYEDDGVGIPEDMKQRLFGKTIGEGSVHGLHLIRRIIESYGGDMREEGQPGKGVKFVITLPEHGTPAPKETPK